MSTLGYAAITQRRSQAEPGTSTSAPGIGTYVDALAALVPVEALTVHAVILSVTTQKQDASTTVITDAATLRWAFWGLVVLSALLYAINRRGWTAWDFARLLIPPAAFVAWTMLQQTTAFDAVAPTLATGPRYVTALFGAIVLGVAASRLGYKADQAPVAADATSGVLDASGTAAATARG